MPPTDPLPMFKEIRPFGEELDELRRETMARFERIEAGMLQIVEALTPKSTKRRRDPESIGLQPLRSGGVAVYLTGVGSGTTNRRILYLGIARDPEAAKDLQDRSLSLLAWALDYPENARDILRYWSARGRYIGVPSKTTEPTEPDPVGSPAGDECSAHEGGN